MVGDRRGWEDGMDAIQRSASETTEETEAFKAEDCCHKIIHVDSYFPGLYEYVLWGGGARCGGGCCTDNVILQGVGRESSVLVHQMVDEVAAGFCGRTEVTGTLLPSHLEGGWNNNFDGGIGSLGQDVAKIILVGVPDDHTPESIREVNF